MPGYYRVVRAVASLGGRGDYAGAMEHSHEAEGLQGVDLRRQSHEPAIDRCGHSKERIEQNPEQVKRILKGFLRSLRAVKADRNDVVEFIGRKYSLDAASADETYKILLQTLSDDGTVPDTVLKELLDQTKQEAGVKRELAIKDIVDYTWVRQVAKEIGR